MLEIVSELIEKRKSEQLAKEELERTKEAQKSDPSNEDTESIVERILAKRQDAEVRVTLESTKENLKNIYPEFSKDKDVAGIVYQDFEKHLNKFNFEGLKTKEEIEQRYKDAYKLWQKSSDKEDVNFYKGSSRQSSDVREDDSATLSAAEASLIKEIGWTKEKYLLQKASKPAYIATLLKFRGV